MQSTSNAHVISTQGFSPNNCEEQHTNQNGIQQKAGSSKILSDEQIKELLEKINSNKDNINNSNDGNYKLSLKCQNSVNRNKLLHHFIEKKDNELKQTNAKAQQLQVDYEALKLEASKLAILGVAQHNKIQEQLSQLEAIRQENQSLKEKSQELEVRLEAKTLENEANKQKFYRDRTTLTEQNIGLQKKLNGSPYYKKQDANLNSRLHHNMKHSSHSSHSHSSSKFTN